MPISQEFLDLLVATTHAPASTTSITESWQAVKMQASSPDVTSKLMDLALVSIDMMIAQTDSVTREHIAHTMSDLHRRKNAGYAGLSSDPWANFREATAFGISAYMGVLVRLSDKYQRYTNVSTNPALEQVNELINETLIDIASYALIAICLYNEQRKKEDACFTASFGA